MTPEQIELKLSGFYPERFGCLIILFWQFVTVILTEVYYSAGYKIKVKQLYYRHILVIREENKLMRGRKEVDYRRRIVSGESLNVPVGFRFFQMRRRNIQRLVEVSNWTDDTFNEAVDSFNEAVDTFNARLIVSTTPLKCSGSRLKISNRLVTSFNGLLERVMRRLKCSEGSRKDVFASMLIVLSRD